ncbi:MAG: hypothetical protein JWP83_1898 [Mycobacterium sp.]|uniref:hypothetical protein n=1 Tax=Mycobacterium sp. TaxID=1785 RepID=UPI0026359BDF|nr:hypothetical protein [Mycobacterium sp.]MCW2660746.1 hypothetical protein [Mycobacterium sp.]
MDQAQQGIPDRQLSAAYFLDDNWEPVERIPAALRGEHSRDRLSEFEHREFSREYGQPSSAKSADDQQMLNWIRGTSIKIAPRAETVKLTPPPDCDFDYLKSELGMNIILPKGRIDELRFNVSLTQVGGTQETFATDGFPNSSIHHTTIVGGQIKIGITQAFRLIPVVGHVVAELLPISVNLNPWSFRIGSLKRIDVAFNGGLTTEPEWYFKNAGIKTDEIRIAMILKKQKKTTGVSAEVKAAWRYNPGGFFPEKPVGSDIKAVTIYGAG